jgi:hypothetical protein
MSAADNYEAANLKEQEQRRREARATISVAAAFAIGFAAVIVSVLACIAVLNLSDALAAARAASRCTLQ